MELQPGRLGPSDGEGEVRLSPEHFRAPESFLCPRLGLGSCSFLLVSGELGRAPAFWGPLRKPTPFLTSYHSSFTAGCL